MAFFSHKDTSRFTQNAAGHITGSLEINRHEGHKSNDSLTPLTTTRAALKIQMKLTYSPLCRVTSEMPYDRNKSIKPQAFKVEEWKCR